MGAFGQVFGSVQGDPVNAKNFIVEKFGLTTILAVNDLTNPILEKEFLIVQDPNQSLIAVPTLWARINAVGRRLTGAGQIRVQLLTSDDGGITWTQRETVQFSGAAFGVSQASIDFSNIGTDINRLAIAFTNNDSISTGEIKEVKAQFGFYLPLNWKISEV